MRRAAASISGALAVALLGLVNAGLYFNPPPISPIAAAAPPQIAAKSSDKSVAPRLNRNTPLVHTLSRPLFSPTRRPWIAPEAAVPDLPPPAADEEPADTGLPPQFTLRGIQTTPTDARVLLLVEGESEAVWKSVGETVNNWKIEAIKASAIELSLDGRTHKLDLYPALPQPGQRP